MLEGKLVKHFNEKVIKSFAVTAKESQYLCC